MSKFNFVLDVDGVMTSGKFLYTDQGKIMKEFGPHDAYSLKKIREHVNIFFISADERGFKISKKRIADIGFSIELVPEDNRYSYIVNNFSFENLIYMGDGDADAQILKDAFIGIAPANSRPNALKVANYITKAIGGEGAVAEACDYLQREVIDKTA